MVCRNAKARLIDVQLETWCTSMAFLLVNWNQFWCREVSCQGSVEDHYYEIAREMDTSVLRQKNNHVRIKTENAGKIQVKQNLMSWSHSIEIGPSAHANCTLQLLYQSYPHQFYFLILYPLDFILYFPQVINFGQLIYRPTHLWAVR